VEREGAMTRGRHGFSLVETLIVIAIMGLLFGLLAAAVLRVRGHVARTRCADAMRQLALALHQYEALHGGLPKGITVAPARPPMRYVSWLTRLTPQMGRDDIWNAARAAYSLSPGFVMEEPHLNLLKTPMSVFRCPADPRNGNGRFGAFEVAFTNYLGFSGTDQYAKDGVLYVDSGVRATDVHDGLSHTILIGERPVCGDNSRYGWWYAGHGQNYDGSAEFLLGVREDWVEPTFGVCHPASNRFRHGRADVACDNLHFWSHHLHGANMAFADGSVHFLSYSLDKFLPALATRAGGEAVDWSP
jgi:prepilin-type N-terminal cleavage/methylation domain-containing protein